MYETDNKARGSGARARCAGSGITGELPIAFFGHCA